ncbi:CpsD/CapB family tyrosine-protein kinase [Marivita sp. S2033]|uniref:CpsD/CapB family tyrosine-protein kinase n=1 Tax=Marivita sp. S2033 TaxID=3373187 RepID=UPI0039823385
MTDTPKFQRRKRRGAVSDSARSAARPSESDAHAQSREKAALEEEKEQAVRATEHTQPSGRDPKTPLVLAKPPAALRRHDAEAVWRSLDRFDLDARRLAKRNVVTALRRDPAHTRFDILRTRMLQALTENGWRRVAITSPTKNCGKTFTAANLAISLSRQENCKTVLLDLDMRSPSLHKVFGVRDPGVISDLLRGDISPERHLQGFAQNDISAGSHVAIGFNGMVEPYAAELLQDRSTERALERIEALLEPDVMLFDLPPALLNDDVLAMRPYFDALLIVAGGGMTRANDIKETERRLGDKVPLLGIVLNKADQAESGDYAY